MRRFEFQEGTSCKFWEVAVEASSVTVRFGRLGSAGQAKSKTLATPSAAEAEAQALISEKTKKGYVEINAAGAAAPLASAPPAARAAKTDVRGVATTEAVKPVLDPASEKAFVKKLKGARDQESVVRIANKAAPAAVPRDLVWSVLGRGLLSPADIGASDGLRSFLSSRLDEDRVEYVPFRAGEVVAGQVLPFVSGLAEASIVGTWEVVPGLSRLMVDLVGCGYESDPAAWESVVDKLAPRLRDAVHMARGRHGALDRVPAVDRERLLGELAAACLDAKLDARSVHAHALGESGKAWGERMLPGLLAIKSIENPHLREANDALLVTPWQSFTDTIWGFAGGWSRLGTYAHGLLPLRKESAETMEAWAEVMRNAPDGADRRERISAIVKTLSGIKKAHPDWVPDPAWDELLVAAAEVVGSSCLLLSELFPHVLGILQGVSAARVHAMMRAMEKAAPGESYVAWPLLRVVFDEERARAVADECRELAAARGPGRGTSPPIALGLIGPKLLSVLEEQFNRPGKVAAVGGRSAWDLRVVFRKAIIVALGVDAAAGKAPEPRWDRYLAPGNDVIDYASAEEIAACDWLFFVLRGMPDERVRPILQAWAAVEGKKQIAMLAALKSRLPGRLFEEAHEPPLIDRLRALIDATGLRPDTRVYVVTPIAEAQPGSLCRIASMPRALSARREPGEHILTLDLELMPELRSRGGWSDDVRAVALFYKPDSGGYSEGELVPMTAEEARAGHDDEGGEYRIDALDVPARVFAEGEEVATVVELRAALASLPGYMLGQPIWIQDPGADGEEFVGQLSESIWPNSNFGGGTLYLCSGGPFFQC